MAESKLRRNYSIQSRRLGGVRSALKRTLADRDRLRQGRDFLILCIMGYEKKTGIKPGQIFKEAYQNKLGLECTRLAQSTRAQSNVFKRGKSNVKN